MESARRDLQIEPGPRSAPSRRSLQRGSASSSSTLIIDVNPCHRHTLLVFNLVIMLFSGVLFGGSVYSLSTRWQDIHLFQGSLVISLLVNLEFPYMVVGTFSFVSAAAGFLGALRENITLLSAYSKVVLLATILIMLAGAFAAFSPFVTRHTVKSLVTIRLIEHYRDNEDFQALIDYIQSTFKCCGVTSNNFRDWNHNVYFNCSKDNPSAERCFVPPSCCKAPYDPYQPLRDVLTRRFCGAQALAMTDQQAWGLIYMRNCADGVLNVIQRNSFYLMAVMLTAFIALVIVHSMVVTVTSELETLTNVYDEYYRALQRGLKKKLAKHQALDRAPAGQLVEIGPPDGAVPVGPVGGGPPYTPVQAAGLACCLPRCPTVAITRGVSLTAVPHVARFRPERVEVLHPQGFQDQNRPSPNVRRPTYELCKKNAVRGEELLVLRKD